MSQALQITNLEKTYSSGLKALININLVINKGDFFALLGPNGAGKTTIIGIITGLVSKSSGEVTVFNSSISTNHQEAKTQIGVVPQEFNFNIFEKVIDIVTDQAGYYGVSRDNAKKSAEKYLKKLGLWEKRNEPSRALSGGMKRRLMIARALVHEPKLLILDEPTAGVDIESRRDMWGFLKKLNQSGLTILLTTHYLEEAEQLCKRLAIIHQGKIIKNGSMKEILGEANSENLILDISKPINSDQIKNLQVLQLTRVAEKTIKISKSKKQSITEIINIFEKQGIEVENIRSESGKLEELFLNLTKK